MGALIGIGPLLIKIHSKAGHLMEGGAKSNHYLMVNFFQFQFYLNMRKSGLEKLIQ